MMTMDNRESMDLLRETLAKYVKDLADELFYWVEELNKLDAPQRSNAQADGSGSILDAGEPQRLG